MRHVLGSIIILIVSAGAGAAARSAWYNNTNLPNLPWVKSESKAPTPPRNDPPPTKDNANDHSEIESQPIISNSTGRDCKKKIDSFCVAELEFVLKHLANGTAFIVDARESGDFDSSHLTGAIHLPSSDIYGNIENVTAMVPLMDQLIIVYCGGGQCEASKNVGQVLRDFNYSNVWLYENGWEEVEASGKFGDYIEMGG